MVTDDIQLPQATAKEWAERIQSIDGKADQAIEFVERLSDIAEAAVKFLKALRAAGYTWEE